MCRGVIAVTFCCHGEEKYDLLTFKCFDLQLQSHTVNVSSHNSVSTDWKLIYLFDLLYAWLSRLRSLGKIGGDSRYMLIQGQKPLVLQLSPSMWKLCMENQIYLLIWSLPLFLCLFAIILPPSNLKVSEIWWDTLLVIFRIGGIPRKFCLPQSLKKKCHRHLIFFWTG